MEQDDIDRNEMSENGHEDYNLQTRLSVLETAFREHKNAQLETLLNIDKRLNRLEDLMAKLLDEKSSFVRAEIYKLDLKEITKQCDELNTALCGRVRSDEYRDDMKNNEEWKEAVNNKLSWLWGALAILTAAVPIVMHFLPAKLF